MACGLVRWYIADVCFVRVSKIRRPSVGVCEVPRPSDESETLGMGPWRERGRRDPAVGRGRRRTPAGPDSCGIYNILAHFFEHLPSQCAAMTTFSPLCATCCLQTCCLATCILHLATCTLAALQPATSAALQPATLAPVALQPPPRNLNASRWTC